MHELIEKMETMKEVLSASLQSRSSKILHTGNSTPA